MNSEIKNNTVSTELSQASQTDQQLISSIGEGQQWAFGRLYDQHVSRMLALACHMLGNQSDAEDVIHDVFIEVWHKAGSYDSSRGSVIAWLMLRVRSRSLDRIRSLATLRRKLLDQAHDASHNEEHDEDFCEQVIAQTRVSQALSSLSEKQRSVVELSYFKGMSCKEIASHCRIPVGTVKTRMMAAMNNLRHLLPDREEL